MPFNHRSNRRAILGWNGFTLGLTIVLIIYGKTVGMAPSLLVQPPPAAFHLYPGFLTHGIQTLCAVPPIACLFSLAVLRGLRPPQAIDRFLVGGAIATGAFLANEILRIHIVIGHAAGIPKWLLVLGFAGLLGVYWYTFRDRWAKTPYGLLVAAGILFILAFSMDLRLLGPDVSALLEGIPKLFSILNYVLYFWLTSKNAVVQALQTPAIAELH